MRNFILFIQRFSNLLLFLVLEIVCITLIARTNMLQGNDIMSSANAVTGLVSEKRENIAYYFRLKHMNDSLLNENARLQALFAEKHFSYDTVKDSAVTRALPGKDSTQRVQYAHYIYRTAKVIKNSIASTNNFITIDRGSKQGIKMNMAVISGNSVEGRVVYVSVNYASALTILNIKQKVSAKLTDGNIGSITWKDGNPDLLFMEDLPQQIKVKIGDSVLSTSYSFFPQDILIGRVVKKKIIKKNSLQLLYIKPSTNFRNLQYVYVIENTKMEERLRLEDSTINNNQ